MLLSILKLIRPLRSTVAVLAISCQAPPTHFCALARTDAPARKGPAAGVTVRFQVLLGGGGAPSLPLEGGVAEGVALMPLPFALLPAPPAASPNKASAPPPMATG
ncbi:hypothetical protein, partial [Herbaspirillum sp. B65]|uniref:hypothetical protein n=1 Tax=Herbaspirillum sp. B65 TaxID=137708 RepID=UPI0011D1AAA0